MSESVIRHCDDLKKIFNGRSTKRDEEARGHVTRQQEKLARERLKRMARTIGSSSVEGARERALEGASQSSELSRVESSLELVRMMDAKHELERQVMLVVM